MKHPVLAALFVLLALPATARTIDLAFMPPKVEPQNICSPDSAGDPKDDMADQVGEGDLTDALRLQYLMHDIRVLQSQDPDRWFDFILTL
ncbi:MAG: hypothetical protein H7317_18505, partial [Pseudorhodobacter sp.]|nr:hypothetical protein [Pseudorhodobacter sp.]